MDLLNRHLRQIEDAFDPLHVECGGASALESCDALSLAVGVSTVAENLRDRLLGTLGRAVGGTDFRLPAETRTPGEKMALQVMYFMSRFKRLRPRLSSRISSPTWTIF